MRDAYAAMARGAGGGSSGNGADAALEQQALHETIELEALLDIEKRTVER
jgi:hypothetical protein